MSSNHQSIFSPRYFALSIGIILSVMAVGFEGLSVTTIAPSIAGDLNGLSLFGWIFSTYLLAQIIGTLVVGRIIDRRGPAVPFTIALLLFIVGLIAAATSGDMYTMIGSRAMQGLGAGAMMTCVYTAISLSYPDELRAKILGAFGTAYVLPSMLGPYVAGLIADQWSWRFVFWGILPILIISALLSLPAFTKLKTPKTQGDIGASSTWMALLLTMGTGIFLVGLSMLPSIMGFVLVLIGLVLMIFPLRKLLPKGTLTLRRGMPAILATRGLFFAAYTSTEFLGIGSNRCEGNNAFSGRIDCSECCVELVRHSVSARTVGFGRSGAWTAYANYSGCIAACHRDYYRILDTRGDRYRCSFWTDHRWNRHWIGASD